jgi:hypothetical protein
MNDIGNNRPIEAHGNNVVSTSDINSGPMASFSSGDKTSPNDNNRHIQLLSEMTAEERRVFWKRSINREMANAAVNTHMDDDDLYASLERLLQDNLTRYNQINARRA